MDCTWITRYTLQRVDSDLWEHHQSYQKLHLTGLSFSTSKELVRTLDPYYRLHTHEHKTMDDSSTHHPFVIGLCFILFWISFYLAQLLVMFLLGFGLDYLDIFFYDINSLIIN